MSALLLAALLLQQEETIPRTHKQYYTAPAKDCERAGEILETDPREAVKLLDAILSDSNVEKRECKLCIEIAPGTKSKWYNFFPYQYRGRARMKLAESAPDRETTERLLNGAVSDLEESARLGLTSSEPLVKTAKEKLAALAKAAPGPTPADPEPEFRRNWARLIDSEKFVAARDHIETQGAFLTAEKKKQYADDTQRECRESLAGPVDRFRAALGNLLTLQDLLDLRPNQFDRDFTLPPRDQLVVTTPEYEWCVAARDALAGLRNGKDAVDALFDRAVAAVPLVAEGQNPYFLAVERLAHEIVRSGIDRCVKDAAGADAEERRKLRSDAEALARRWKAFDDRVRKASEKLRDFAKQIPARDFSPIFDRFPQDASGLDKVLASLDSTVYAENPDRELEAVDGALRAVLADQPNLTVESRRRVLTLRVIVGALRGFLAERTAEDIATGLRQVGTELKKLGGPTQEGADYGPKVRQVFDKLR